MYIVKHGDKIAFVSYYELEAEKYITKNYSKHDLHLETIDFNELSPEHKEMILNEDKDDYEKNLKELKEFKL